MSIDAGSNGIGRMLDIMRNVAHMEQGNGLVLGEYLGDKKFQIEEHVFKEGEYQCLEGVFDKELEFTFEDKTEARAGGSGYAQFESHDHDVKWIKKKITLHTTLEKGDIVLAYQFGDEDYVIIGKVV